MDWDDELLEWLGVPIVGSVSKRDEFDDWNCHYTCLDCVNLQYCQPSAEYCAQIVLWDCIAFRPTTPLTDEE